MPTEVESAPHAHRCWSSEKSGVHGNVTDLTTRSKIGAQELSGKVKGVLDLEVQIHREGEIKETVSVRIPEEEVYPMAREPNEGTSGDFILRGEVGNANAVRGLSKDDAPSTVFNGGCGALNSTSEWCAPEANSGWEVVGNDGVLGRGPTTGKVVELMVTAPPELYSYWMVKFPRPVNLKAKTEIRMAEMRVKKSTEKRDFITAALQLQRVRRSEVIDRLRAARNIARACGDAFRRKKDEIGPLHAANTRIREAGRLARDKSRDLPANEQELDQKIADLEYIIQYESIPLKEEKQLVRDIKNLKCCREEVCTKAAAHAEFAETLGGRDEIQGRLRPLLSELEALKAEWGAASERVKAAEVEFAKIDEAFNQIQTQWAAASRARQDAFNERSCLMRQDNANNDEFYQNRRDFNHVRQLAFNKERKLVEEFCKAQMERVLGMWNTRVEFRANYVKSNEWSTFKRRLKPDGRTYGPDEEMHFIPTDSENTVPEPTPDAGTPASPTRSSRTREVQPNGQAKSVEAGSIDLPKKESERDISGTSISVGKFRAIKATSAVTRPSDSRIPEQIEVELAAAVELKRKRREQEMAKAKAAEERKRRMAARKQSKAILRTQKETQKIKKEQDKRARKKAAASGASAEGMSSSTETTPREVLQKVDSEAVPKATQETNSECESSLQQRKMLNAVFQHKAASKSVKKPAAVPSIFSKKGGISEQNLSTIVLGLVLLFGLLAMMARHVL